MSISILPLKCINVWHNHLTHSQRWFSLHMCTFIINWIYQRCDKLGYICIQSLFLLMMIQPPKWNKTMLTVDRKTVVTGFLFHIQLQQFNTLYVQHDSPHMHELQVCFLFQNKSCHDDQRPWNKTTICIIYEPGEYTKLYNHSKSVKSMTVTFNWCVSFHTLSFSSFVLPKYQEFPCRWQIPLNFKSLNLILYASAL